MIETHDEIQTEPGALLTFEDVAGTRHVGHVVEVDELTKTLTLLRGAETVEVKYGVGVK